jgi:3-deoxy-D-manno-octulosonic-acid transferase
VYFLYTLITATGALLLLPYFALERWRRGKHFHGLKQRLGFYPATIVPPETAADQPGTIWIHAVSVGEVLAALPLGRRLKQDHPSRRIVLSATTPTGEALARERADFAAAVFYFPLDWPGPVGRAFRMVRPALVVIVETEIWPNFLRTARRLRVPVAFVNGRISEGSFARTLRFSGAIAGFVERVLADARVFMMQSDDDARRIRQLGAPPECVETTGNLKYDVTPPEGGALLSWLEQQIREQERWPVIVAGSVVADEEEEVLAAFDVLQRKWRHALLVLAPRKPERFDAAARISQERGWKVVRRSGVDLNAPLDEAADILLLDSMGELAALYRAADAVFVGGSLVPASGHNILEPACCGKPPVFGPSMENFRQMAAEFVGAGAAVQVSSSQELARAWIELLEDAPRREKMAAAARSLVERNQGATERTVKRLAEILEAAGAGARARRLWPQVKRALPSRPVLLPLGLLYGAGARARAWLYRRRIVSQKRLPQVVVSVGNLTVGGTGKTPMVLWLAERALAEGKRVGILSRGYPGAGNRKTGNGGQTSDEVRMLRERTGGKVPIGVGANRFAEALRMEKEKIEWFLLDDGFQHLHLARDADIVLVDAMNPTGGNLLPAGERREPLSALGRADILVITRSARAPAIEAGLRRYTDAPIYYAQPRLESILPVPGSARASGPLSAPGSTKFCAFCGIGNPAGFFRDLEDRWGFYLVGLRLFRDHHVFTPAELRNLERAAQEMGAEALICTEKDIYNLPAQSFEKLPAYYCRIGMELSDPDEFWRTILAVVERRRAGAAR